MSYSYLQLIEDVLKQEKRAMQIREIWEIAEKNGLASQLDSIGKTPLKTMNACIHKNINKGNEAIFVQVNKKPALFRLKD